MGNTSTHVTSGVKEQAASGSAYTLYKYINGSGGGELVEKMKKANRTKNYSELDKAIRDRFADFVLGDQGKGVKTSLADLVKRRAADGKRKRPEPTGPSGEDYKMTCWRLDQRGAVGENPLHLCLLNNTSIHADLAKRLLHNYPALIHDIYTSDEYFGETALHMAIVNEDPAMVKYLLDKGADIHQRCSGKFFTPTDQKDKRKDSLEQEWCDLPQETNYEGPVSFGEYALSFAACLGQEECVRLLIARGAKAQLQDSNGNTVLHSLVVHKRQDMFDLLMSYEDNAGLLHVANNQGLTPLTLAAKLSRDEMFHHILDLERREYWTYGNVSCAAYPLQHIDSIKEDGEINENSALYHVVFGEETGHLSMISGIVHELLLEKWNKYIQKRFYALFFFFSLYFITFALAFYFRPGYKSKATVEERNISNVLQNVTVIDPCFLFSWDNDEDKARVILEILALLGTAVYVILSILEIYFNTYAIFWKTLSSSPAKFSFLVANAFVICMVPCRAACMYYMEEIFGVFAILFTAPYFLFFCRGFKIVGPFVIMIYKMIKTDLLRFFSIYLIFLVGFSQAMFVLFRGIETEVFSNGIDAIMGMFIMSLGEFGDMYETFDRVNASAIPKLIFAVYMILVTLLLVNMLIAMMGNTYQMVNETQKEWLRQWARIILVTEQTLRKSERKAMQKTYSQAMPVTKGEAAQGYSIRWHQTDTEKEERKKRKEENDSKLKALIEKKKEEQLEKTKREEKNQRSNPKGRLPPVTSSR